MLKTASKVSGTAESIVQTLAKRGCEETARSLHRFFKTGKGAYGEGDAFRGISVPDLRAMLPLFTAVPIEEVRKVLDSPWHEDRLFGLLLLVRMYANGGDVEKKAVYTCYMGSTARVNNWDLVDLSAPYISGPHLLNRSRNPLYRLAESRVLWDRRIALLSTFYFIRQHDFEDTLTLSEKYLGDTEDLIHKATGWMLREVGKRDITVLEQFLKRHYSDMPRTALRYAIEKFPEELRQAYLHGDI